MNRYPKRFPILLLLLTIAGATTSLAQVQVADPTNGATLSPAVHFVASAGPGSCSHGVAAMGVYIDNELMYTVNDTSLDTTLSLGAGQHRAVVQEWDYCGGALTAPLDITVEGTDGGTTLTNLQAASGWNQWGELPPSDAVCSAPCSGKVWWSMYQHESAVSLSGNATQFNTGGNTPFADVLWYYDFIGDGAPVAMRDGNHTLLPTLHNFSMDEEVYVTNLAATQAVELDINMYMDGAGMEWGTQCNHLGDGKWDIWNNVDAHWMATDAPCNLNEDAWNHVVLQVQRQPNNDLLYQSITVNNVTYMINRTVAPFQVDSEWWGMNVNFQMDGNSKPSPNTEYLDKFNVTYQ